MLSSLDVEFPSESCLVSGELPVRSGHRIKGGGIGATTVILNGAVTDSHGLFYANSGGAITFIEDVFFSDMTLDGQVETAGFSEFQHLVSLNGVDGARFSNVKFKGFRGDGLYLGSVGGERHNKNVVVDSTCLFDGVNNDNRNGISIIDCDGFTCSGVTFQNTTKATMPACIDVEPNANAYHVVKNITITNNKFKGFGGATGAISFVLTAATFTVQPEFFVVTGNEFQISKTAFAFLSDGAYSRPLDIVYSNNVGITSIPFNVQGSIKGLSITGNVLRGSDRSYLGFDATDTVIDTIVNDNIFFGDDTTKGVVVRSASNLQIANNTFSDIGDYCVLLGTSGATISDVSIKGNTTNSSAAGVEFGAGTISGVKITDNNFTGATNPIEGTIPVDTIIRGNAAPDEAVTATNVITADESGRTFYLNASGGFTSTLPLPHKGLKYTFIVKTAPATAYIITTNAGANLMYGTYLDIVGELTYFAAQDTLNFVASTSVVGDRLEVESDGAVWYCKAFSGADGGITTSAT
jgi:hypothetical protein